METKYDVFISYSRKDYIDENTKVVIPDNPVSKIMKAFDDAGITYWIDKKGIYSGDEFSGVIADAIEASNVFVFVSSESSNISKWTLGEIATAQEAKKTIIPVRIDSSRYHKSLRVRLNALDYIDFTSNSEEETQSLIIAIKAYLTQIKEEEERQKEEKRKKEELERQEAEEAKRKQEEEAKRKQEEQQKLIDGIKKDCTALNIKETQLELERQNLLIRAETVAAQEQRKELKSFIENSSPITKKYEEQLSMAKKQAQHNSEKIIVKPNNKKLHIIYVCIILLLLAVGFGLFIFPKRMSPEEQYQLGVSYYTGECVTKDYNKAVEFFQKAAEQGYAEAQNNLGDCYFYGDGVTKDYTEAVNWYKKAAEQGYAEAQNNLGICLYYGYGVTKKQEEAVTWFRKAAEQGYANAQNWLGVCYYNGYGVMQKYEEAVTWFRKAARQGYPAAHYWLGECYYYGHGVPKDPTKAKEWYRKAADLGHDLSKTKLERLKN